MPYVTVHSILCTVHDMVIANCLTTCYDLIPNGNETDFVYLGKNLEHSDRFLTSQARSG